MGNKHALQIWNSINKRAEIFISEKNKLKKEAQKTLSANWNSRNVLRDWRGFYGNGPGVRQAIVCVSTRCYTADLNIYTLPVFKYTWCNVYFVGVAVKHLSL